MRLHALATTAIAVLALAAAPPATAQSVQSAIEQSAPAVSDAELKSFAVAVLEVRRITDTYVPMLKTATTIEEQQQVEKAASAEMKQAVENEGMTVGRFNQILTLARIDPDLTERIRRHIKQPQ